MLPPVTRLINPGKKPGLRERQKLARYARILASARKLIKSQNFEEVTMAAIAEHAEVSTPTVFNYFKTKDQLLLALVLQVHKETQESIQGLKPRSSRSTPDSVCDFLSMYTQSSLKSINRQTWRHVESTHIRLPDSDFVKQYELLSKEMLGDFSRFLVRSVETDKSVNSDQLKRIAEILFNHWSALFIELVRNDSITFENHVEQLRGDMTALFSVVNFDG